MACGNENINKIGSISKEDHVDALNNYKFDFDDQNEHL